MTSLEEQLIAADENNARFKLISTDGVFSMDGHVAQLDKICQLANRYNALVHVDDSHSTGFMGTHGKGTHEYRDVLGKIDIITGTLGKALGGASGGFTSGHKEIVALLRQRSRPYLFSNTVAPPVVAGAIRALALLESSTALRDKLEENTRFFRAGLKEKGLDIIDGEHPIVPVMLYDATVAGEFAERMLEKGVYVVAFSYPVVPLETARIRTQISAAHTKDDLQFAIDSFGAVKKEMGL
jgi:glycine C-acetyltransferase